MKKVDFIFTDGPRKKSLFDGRFFQDKPVRRYFKKIRENRRQVRKSNFRDLNVKSPIKDDISQKKINGKTWTQRQYELLKKEDLNYQITLENKFTEMMQNMTTSGKEVCLDQVHASLNKEQTLNFFKISFGDISEEIFDKVFNLMDSNQDGFVDGQEFAVTMCFLIHKGSARDNMETAFNLFDTDKDGIMSKQEFSDMIPTILGPTLDSLLTIPDARRCLKEFLRQELSEELLIFYEEMEEKNREYYVKGMPISVADKLLDSYIRVDSEFQLNISGRERECLINAVEHEKARGGDTIPVDYFDRSVHEAVFLLEQGAVIRFKKAIKSLEYDVFVNVVWESLGLEPDEGMTLDNFRTYMMNVHHLFDFLDDLKSQLEDEIRLDLLLEDSKTNDSDMNLANKFFML